MTFFLKHIKKNWPLAVLILVFGFLFFYRLNYNTLTSWDEGWYASIARNMVKTGDFLRMMWNGQPYYDHPPMGFWLMAISYKLFGINEFATRLPSALLGLLAILLVYKTGVKLFEKRLVGFVAAMIMGTSVWYVIRVRSGNLDSIFVFFYILTIYLSAKSAKNFKWFPLVGLSFGGLILSKTLVGTSAIVLILFMNLRQLINWKNILYILLAAVLFTGLVYPWYWVQLHTYSQFYDRHFIEVGTRNKPLSSYFHLLIGQPLFYIHMGMRKWYYFWPVALLLLGATFKFLKKNIFLIILWNLVVLYPFLTSEKTELWHLIPVYLPISFIIAVGFYEGIKKFIKNRLYVNLIFLALFIPVIFLQIKTFYREVIPPTKYIPDDVDISRKVTKYNKPIILDDDFVPLAVFYSGQNMRQMAYIPGDKQTITKFFQSDENNFVVVTRNWALHQLDEAKIPYKLLERNNTYSIITRP